MTPHRDLPNDHDAERQLLGCCLIDGAQTVGRAIDAGLTMDSFYTSQHSPLFGLLIEMVSTGAEISDATVFIEMSRRRMIEPLGGPAAFAAIARSVPTTASAAQLIARVAELACLRAAIRIATGMIERAHAYAGGGLSEVIARPISDLLALSNTDRKPDLTWAETVDQAVSVADELIASQGKPLAASISFPWRQMNQLFGPMQRGQLIVIAARTSIGKSSLTRPMVCHAAKNGCKVYFDTLEEDPVRVALQMAAAVSRVGVRQLGTAHNADQQDFKRALLSLRAAGITISRKDRAIGQIIGRTKALHAQGKIDIAFIDHGGYIDQIARAPQSEKAGAIGIVTKALKVLAVDLNIPVVLLWQLNRGSEKEANREPQLFDLKDSGSVEEDADKVIFLHRPSENPLTKCTQSSHATVEDCPRYFQNVIQAKGRDEGTTFMSFYFDRRTASFEPIQNDNERKDGLELPY